MKLQHIELPVLFVYITNLTSHVRNVLVRVCMYKHLIVYRLFWKL